MSTALEPFSRVATACPRVARYKREVCTVIAVAFVVVLHPRVDSTSPTAGQAGWGMTTSFAVSSDGTRIAFDVAGKGPAVVLLHGGGQSRRVWHEAGYVGRLANQFTVITIDLRGHGESDKPTSVDGFAVDRLTDDILAVAEATHVARFAVWGYSYGGNIARYLPARSDRVSKLVIIGSPFGAAAPQAFRALIRDLRAKWGPIVDRDRAGTLDVGSLSAEDRAVWQTGTPLGSVPVVLAWLVAMLDWPSVEPADLRCPTLWLVGTGNENAMPSVNEYSESLARTKVKLHLVPALTHEEELAKVDEVFPPMLKFTESP
jgi:pimeloyl-ACP methyl ester carboxylesterase